MVRQRSRKLTRRASSLRRKRSQRRRFRRSFIRKRRRSRRSLIRKRRRPRRSFAMGAETIKRFDGLWPFTGVGNRGSNLGENSLYSQSLEKMLGIRPTRIEVQGDKATGAHSPPPVKHKAKTPTSVPPKDHPALRQAREAGGRYVRAAARKLFVNPRGSSSAREFLSDSSSDSSGYTSSESSGSGGRTSR